MLFRFMTSPFARRPYLPDDSRRRNSSVSDVSEDAVQRARHPVELKSPNEQRGVPCLPTAPGAHETPELVLDRSPPLRGLPLEDSERGEFPLRLYHDLYGLRPEGTDQLVLQVGIAHVEAEGLHVCAGDVRTETGPFETSPEVALLRGVAEPGQRDVRSPRTESFKEAAGVLRAADRHDRDAFRLEISPAAPSERFERVLVTDTFDEHNRPWRGRNLPGQVPSRSSRRCRIGHAPSDEFDMTV